MSDAPSSLSARLVTAAVAIPLLLGALLWGGPGGIAAVIALGACVGAWEFCSIAFGDTLPGAKYASVAGTAAIVACFLASPLHAFEALVGATVCLGVISLIRHEDRAAVPLQFGAATAALVYCGGFLGSLIPASREPGGPFWILMAMIVVWLSDTAAYFVGRAAGERPLAPSISPNKTVEGALGGFAGSIVGAFGCNWLFGLLAGWGPLPAWPPLSTGTLLVIAIPANLLAQTGDLVESLAKRARGVDDSGTLLYGHGGILDRIDGLLFAAPWFYGCAVYFV